MATKKKTPKLYVVGEHPSTIEHGSDTGFQLKFINGTVECCAEACSDGTVDMYDDDELVIYELVPVKVVKKTGVQVTDYKG